jgi:hypothetical protein
MRAAWGSARLLNSQLHRHGESGALVLVKLRRDLGCRRAAVAVHRFGLVAELVLDVHRLRSRVPAARARVDRYVLPSERVGPVVREPVRLVVEDYAPKEDGPGDAAWSAVVEFRP